MWRWVFARHAARNFINASHVPKVPLSNPKFLNPSPHSTSPSLIFPQIASCLCNNPRFFSQLASEITDSTLTPDNEVSMTHSSVGEESLEENGGGVQMDGYTSGGEQGEMDDGGDVQMDAYASGDEQGVGEDGGDEQGAGEEKVYEINVEKLENVLSLLQSSADGSLESSLDDLDLTLHEEFVIKVIETPCVLGENLLRFFKWSWNEKSFEVTTRVLESLVSAICSGLRKKEIYSLWDLVKDIGEKENGVINVEILNQLIISFSKLGKGKAAMEAFDKFEGFQCVPNVDTYYFTIEALCRRSTFDWAWSVCQKMLDAQSLPDGAKVGKIISWFCKGKKAKEAHALYMAAKEKGKHPPWSSFNFLVVKLCQENETVQLALEMLNDIPEKERKRAIKPFLAVVRALCRIKDVDMAKELILKMIAEGPPPGNGVFNFIVTGYSKVGEMGQAMEMVKLMESRGLKPDVYTYTVLMSGYSNGGEMEEARKILEEAKKKHSKLSPVMYHTLIRGYCKLEQFDEALKFLTEMKDFGVNPNVDEYEKLIQSLCLKALDWETAEKLLEEMKENGLRLKGISRGLIRAVKEMEKEVVEAGKISSDA